MRRFVEGNDAQFQDLKEWLQDGLCHVFKRCGMPDCCSIPVSRIGFEKDHGAYTLLVDKGITCSRRKGGIPLIQFKQLLSDGEIKFIDFNDLKVFLKSLSFLYH